MVKTFSILKKNFQIAFNSKTSSFILILGPIILIGLIGFALQDTSLKNARAGVFINDQDTFSNSFIQRLTERNFQVFLMNSLEDCRKQVVTGTNHVCIELKKETLT